MHLELKASISFDEIFLKILAFVVVFFFLFSIIFQKKHCCDYKTFKDIGSLEYLVQSEDERRQ